MYSENIKFISDKLIVSNQSGKLPSITQTASYHAISQECKTPHLFVYLLHMLFSNLLSMAVKVKIKCQKLSLQRKQATFLPSLSW